MSAPDDRDDDRDDDLDVAAIVGDRQQLPGEIEHLWVQAGERLVTRGAADASATRFPLLCAGKPMVAAALLRLVAESATARLTDPVGRYVAGFDAADKAGIRLIDLLTHRTGILREPIPRGWPDDRILKWINASPVNPQGSMAPRYSMFTSWYLVGRVIETLTGSDHIGAVRELVLHPLGISARFGPEPDPPASAGPLAGIIDARGRDPGPLPWVTDERVLSAGWAGVGICAAVRQLARFYHYLVEPERHALPPCLVAALRRLSAPVDGAVELVDGGALRRSYSAGACTGTGWIGPRFAFPVTGLESATGTIGFADQTNRLALAYASNSMRGDTATLLRRRRLLQAVYRRCGIEAFPAANPGQDRETRY